jgi:hypothetical protein
MASDAVVHARQDDIRRIAARHGVTDVRLFGSRARGEANHESDVDLLVRMEPGRSLLDLGGFQHDVESLLGVPVDVVTEAGLKRRIRDRVVREAVPL